MNLINRSKFTILTDSDILIVSSSMSESRLHAVLIERSLAYRGLILVISKGLFLL